MTETELIEQAKKMLPFSYAPYSNFSVGAALECADGTIYTGCNVENASYGAAICAERTALVKAVSEGHRNDFVRLAVISDSPDYCRPCGICRQMLLEFAPHLKILSARNDGSYVSQTLDDLLPHGFGPKSLNS